MSYSEPQTSKLRQTSVTSSIEEFDTVLDRVAKVNERLHMLHDRLHGPRPEVAPGGAAEKPQHSVISSIYLRRERLVALMDSIERTLDGLESGI